MILCQLLSLVRRDRIRMVFLSLENQRKTEAAHASSTATLNCKLEAENSGLKSELKILRQQVGELESRLSVRDHHDNSIEVPSFHSSLS